MKFSAIIVSYNGAAYLETCITSLMRCVPEIDIIVVDNASQDDSRTIVSAYQNVFLIKLERNIGFGAANNLGIEYAYNTLNSEFFLLINQDAYINSDSWSGFIDLPKKVQNNLIGLMQFGPENNSFDFNFRKLYITESNCPGIIEDSFHGRIKDYYEAKFINAAAWVVPRKLIEDVGGFSPAFFHYGEDNNFIHRVHYWGYKLFLTPKISVIHDRFESLRNSSAHHRVENEKIREITLALSNPNHLVTKWSFCRRIIKWNLKDIMSFRIGRNATGIISLKLLLNGTVSRALNYRNKSLEPTSFLNLEKNTTE